MPKTSSKSLNSSFFVSNLNQKANEQEFDRIVCWEIWMFFERKTPTSNQFDILLISLWPGLNNAVNVFQSLPSLIETSIFATWSLVRQGSFALRPLVNELQIVSSWNWAAGRRIHNTYKHFFRIRKVKAISALDDELWHQQMSQNNAIWGNFCPKLY